MSFTYTQELKDGCRAIIKKLRYNYQSLEYILNNSSFITSNVGKYGEASVYRVEVAKKFIEEHPINHISDFITDTELEAVLEEAGNISAKLNEYFEGFTEPPYEYVVEGLFQKCSTRNSGRIYSKALWKKYVDDDISSGGPTSPSQSSWSSSSTGKNHTKLKSRWSMSEIKDIISYKAYTKHEDTKRNPAMVHYQ